MRTSGHGPGYDVWFADFERACKAVKPYVFTDDEGSWIDPETGPPEINRHYTQVRSIGIFYGYL
jgi:hypothetical protein